MEELFQKVSRGDGIKKWTSQILRKDRKRSVSNTPEGLQRERKKEWRQENIWRNNGPGF